MSIAAEYGWGLALNSGGEGEVTVENWDATTAPGAVKETTSTSGGYSNFGFDVDNAGGSIILSLYF